MYIYIHLYVYIYTYVSVTPSQRSFLDLCVQRWSTKFNNFSRFIKMYIKNIMTYRFTPHSLRQVLSLLS